MTALILITILVFGVVAYRRYVAYRSKRDRRITFAWGWAFWGALAGSFFGIAGFGGAIAGTSVGALLGYLAATAFMKVDPEEPSASLRNAERWPMADDEDIAEAGDTMQNDKDKTQEAKFNEELTKLAAIPKREADSREDRESIFLRAPCHICGSLFKTKVLSLYYCKDCDVLLGKP